MHVILQMMTVNGILNLVIKKLCFTDQKLVVNSINTKTVCRHHLASSLTERFTDSDLNFLSSQLRHNEIIIFILTEVQKILSEFRKIHFCMRRRNYFSLLVPH